MPHKQQFFDFIAQHSSRIGLALLTIIAVIGRVFYTGAKWREVVGDMITCPLITLVLVAALPTDMHITIYQVSIPVSPELLAVAVGIAGMHGLRYAATWGKTPGLKESKNNG